MENDIKLTIEIWGDRAERAHEQGFAETSVLVDDVFDVLLYIQNQRQVVEAAIGINAFLNHLTKNGISLTRKNKKIWDALRLNLRIALQEEALEDKT